MKSTYYRTTLYFKTSVYHKPCDTPILIINNWNTGQLEIHQLHKDEVTPYK